MRCQAWGKKEKCCTFEFIEGDHINLI